MTNTNYQLVAFDMDGTILDTRRMHAAIFEKFFAEKGMSISSEMVEQLIGKSVDFLFQELGFATKVVTRLIREIDVFYGGNMKPYYKLARVIPESVATLRRIREMGLKTVLATNSMTRITNELLAEKELDMLFDHVTTAHVDSPSKTNRLDALFGNIGISRKEIFYVGDLPSDMKVASGLGVTSCLVYNEYGWHYPRLVEEIKYKPDHVVGSIKEVIPLISR